MSKVYLVRNSDILQNAFNYENNNNSLENNKDKEILSCTGEDIALNISKCKYFHKLDRVYSSSYVSALSTAKYIARANNIKINISDKLNDRKVGSLDDIEPKEYKNKSIHNLDYKMKNGESINDVKKRVSSYLKDVLFQEYERIAIITHEDVIISLLLNWCEMGYNYDDNLILNYKEQVIYDGSLGSKEIIILDFDGVNLINIEKDIVF